VATAVVAVLFGLLLGLRFGDARLLLIGAVMLLSQFSISALNDWADSDLDAAAKRRRPIPLGLLRRHCALLVATAFGAISLIVSGLAGLGLIATLLLALGLACGWIYNLALKRTVFSFVPFAVAFPLMAVWVGVIAHRPAASLPILVIGGVPVAIAIHLADAIPDRDDDAASGVRTLAVRLGRPAAEIAALALLLTGAFIAGTLAVRRGDLSAAVFTPVLFAADYSFLMFGRGGEAFVGMRPLIAKVSLVVGGINVAIILVLSA
jgi:4-hydroxybenzoate polyprenyltransferase